ncbi:MAG: hypothetical protein HLUCCA12_12390 [Rhodobacteraceae bacterium HLUCCA12]|nr:MAG: hypothetical protein HLUCCA12_12390 [Rhodobacteraceae bacterium HLUCCA12]
MEPAILGIVAASALAGVIPAWLLARFARVWMGWALAGGCALCVVALLIAGRGAQGWDGLAYAILAIFFAAPATLGALLGTALGGWMRRNA